MRFALFIDNRLAMRGDGSSMAIIYNNLIGVNAPYGDETPDGLDAYRRFMGNRLFSNENAFAEGATVTLVSLPITKIATYQIGDTEPLRVTSEMVEDGPGGFAHLGDNYPEPIASKYSAKDPIDAHSGRIEDYRYNGPSIKTTVRALAVQHFCVYAEPEHQLLTEFPSKEGRAAFEAAVLYADERGLPWQVSGGAEVFDPSTAQLWSL